MTALLALDTGTERMIVAVGVDDRVGIHEGPGGAKASTLLIGTIMRLLDEAAIGLRDLDAIAFARGPGAFTGLRTACSVTQGLAFGVDKPVLPIDSLLVVAENARDGARACRVWATIDARMDQIYAAEYEFAAGAWLTREAPMLTDCEELHRRWQSDPPERVAGDALTVFGDRLQTGSAMRQPKAATSGRDLLALARGAWARGEGVDAALALPLYVRDKVALTTLEREARR
ncbi:MAG TPA: tRNA (adenosine(37)-N6)-threonylcarbamoyltransferase complex dimerization subunit type 1 TsaB [Caldimonas sp.]|nr:tRNA (adenosine(37)-N6)-threonylcarbamoyltransferase complex dimerization subunit type 1 TsaB [Caldimonas sp.]